MIIIPIGSVGNRHLADKFIEAVNGKTYMDFRVTVCPIGGGFQINVETDYDTTHQEAVDMLLYHLFTVISK